MSSLLYRTGRFAALHPWRAIGLWVMLAAAVIAGAGSFGRGLEDSFSVPGLDSQRAVDLLSAAGADQAGITARVVATPLEPGAGFDGSALIEDELTAIKTSLGALPNVLRVDDARSPDGRVALVTVQYGVLQDLTHDDLDRLKEAVEAERVDSPLQIEMGGDLFFSFEEPESGTGELIGLLVAAAVLLLAFGSVIAMGLPIGIAVFGLVLGIASMPLVTYLIDIPSWAPQMASMVGLGVGIDYALLLVTRHREFLAQGLSVVESAARATATAGLAVVFAGCTVVIAILGLAAAGVPFLTAAGVATSIVVLLMVIASVTLLPALLGLAGHSVNRFGIHRRGRDLAATLGQVSMGWERWGRHVSRHAAPYAIGITLALLALSAPVLALQLGFPDEGSQPVSRTERRAYDLVAEGFGPGTNGPLLIAVDISSDPGVIDPLVTAIAADDGIAVVAPALIDETSGVATIVAIPVSAPQDDATYATVERLRAEVLPSVLVDRDAVAHVGGQTANFGDVANRVNDRLPLFIAAVVGLSFLLLTVVFRSILVALKAAVLNLLSIGAAYGVLVMVFQWGWGKGLIGLETTVPIVSFVPMFMFAVLFGLSMDYEVFLLSRVREAYLASGDNDASVIRGLAGTARVITSAALIMIAVFAGFMAGSDPVAKMVGLGLATAILVDATVVRVILVPAVMKLMGRANWWLPGWLDRLLPEIDLEGGHRQAPSAPAGAKSPLGYDAIAETIHTHDHESIDPLVSA